MELGKSSNPALNKNTFINLPYVAGQSEVMTIQGTVNKVFIMLFLVVIAALYTWGQFFSGTLNPAWLWVGVIGGLVLALVTVFKKEWSPFTAPLYAVFEGLFLGALSAMFESQFNGLVIQAVSLTFATLFALLFIYKTGMIKVTENFKLGVAAATGAIAIVYLVGFIMSLFGSSVSFIHDASLFSIGLSIVVVVIASLNLVLDFDFIEQGAAVGAPKYMEWYGAFGLMVTLIWLYIEMLRLLSKLARRD